jgi:Fe-S-cluster containining protein
MSARRAASASRQQRAWYADGLRFECTACGHCCRWGEGYVWVSEREIHAMADSLGLDVLRFARDYVRRVGTHYSLKERPDYRCVLLDDRDRCRVYPVRPTQCRTYPFWREHLKSAKAWQALAEECPGLGQGRLYSADEVDALARETDQELL